LRSELPFDSSLFSSFLSGELAILSKEIIAFYKRKKISTMLNKIWIILEYFLEKKHKKMQYPLKI